ncbi:MAG: hypothetical protein R3Y23_02645 [Bacillota bacterium]
MSWDSFKKWLMEDTNAAKTVATVAETYSDSSALAPDLNATTEQYAANKTLAEELEEMEANYWTTQATDAPDYDSIIPTSLGLTKESYITTPETAMVAEATEQADAQKEADINTMTADYNSDITDINNDIEYVEATKATTEAELNAELESMYQAAQNTAINNGITNSSIATNMQDSVTEYGNLEYQKIDNEYDAKLKNLQSEITKTETAYSLAIASYDLTYAANLQSSLSTIKAEESDRLQEIRDYNTYVDEQEAAYTTARTAEIAALEEARTTANSELSEKAAASIALGESIAPQDISYRNSVYEKVLDYYTTDMTTSQAIQLATANSYSLKMYMGEELYYQLIQELNNAT